MFIISPITITYEKIPSGEKSGVNKQTNSFYELSTRWLQIPVQCPQFLAETDWYQTGERPLRQLPSSGPAILRR